MKNMPPFSEHAEQVLYPEKIQNRKRIGYIVGIVVGAVIGLTQVWYHEKECLPEMRYPWLNQLWEALFPENVCRLGNNPKEILPQEFKNLTRKNLVTTDEWLCILDYSWETETVCVTMRLQPTNSIQVTKWK